MENKQDNGFTLVVPVIGILATVTVFAVRGITNRGQTNACGVDRKTLNSGIEVNYAVNQTDPPTIGSLTTGVNALLRTDPTVGSTANWAFVYTGTPPTGSAASNLTPATAGGKCAGTP